MIAMRVPTVKCFLISLLWLRTVYGDCDLNFAISGAPLPQLSFKLGSRFIDIPITPGYTMKSSTYLYVSCPTGFTQREGNMTIYCEEYYLYEVKGRLNHIDASVLECRSDSWQLYESAEPYEWCEPVLGASYILVSKSFESIKQALLICYNIGMASIKSIRYVSSRQDNQVFPQVPDLETYDLNVTVDILNPLFPGGSNLLINDDQFHLLNLEYWLERNDYIKKPIIKDIFEKTASKSLQVSFWQNLWYNNWQTFLNALDEQMHIRTYNIHSGISDSVQILQPGKCMKMEKVDLLVNGQVPAYIWSHVQSEDMTEDFVFVSYNAPFTDLFDDILFCKNICDEIPWLRQYTRLFGYTRLGKSFCCSISEVRASKRLTELSAGYVARPESATEISVETV